MTNDPPNHIFESCSWVAPLQRHIWIHLYTGSDMPTPRGFVRLVLQQHILDSNDLNAISTPFINKIPIVRYYTLQFRFDAWFQTMDIQTLHINNDSIWLTDSCNSLIWSLAYEWTLLHTTFETHFVPFFTSSQFFLSCVHCLPTRRTYSSLWRFEWHFNCKKNKRVSFDLLLTKKIYRKYYFKCFW